LSEQSGHLLELLRIDVTADESGVFVDFGTQQERIAAPYTKLTKL